MDFQTAVKQGFRNYINFSGRASRSEFWYWVLFAFIMSILISGVDKAIGSDNGVVSALWALFLFLPNISITVRRLHDIDKSGWWILIGIIPLIGWVFLLIWECTKGTLGPNRFGSNPLPVIDQIT